MPSSRRPPKPSRRSGGLRKLRILEGPGSRLGAALGGRQVHRRAGALDAGEEPRGARQADRHALHRRRSRPHRDRAGATWRARHARRLRAPLRAARAEVPTCRRRPRRRVRLRPAIAPDRDHRGRGRRCRRARCRRAPSDSPRCRGSVTCIRSRNGSSMPSMPRTMTSKSLTTATRRRCVTFRDAMRQGAIRGSTSVDPRAATPVRRAAPPPLSGASPARPRVRHMFYEGFGPRIARTSDSR